MPALPPDSSASLRGPVWSHPYAFLGLALALIFVGLLSRSSLAIGPSYWDLSIYLDAAHRIANGQMPSKDFLTPAGPLEYYLFSFVNRLFPDSHPLLATHWAIIPIALPLFVLLIASVDGRSRNLALFLTLPFICFALLPVNSTPLYPAPGFDGYGIYNRHPALVLYILVAALLFVENRIKLQIIVGVSIFLLFMIKITGFATGVFLIAYALAARRLRISDTVICAACVLAVLGVLELSTGLISAYLENVLQLALLNEGSFLRRYKAFIGSHLELFVPILFAATCLILATLHQDPNKPAGGIPIPQRIHRILASNSGWLCAILAAAFVFEIQNTGSHEFIYVLPAIFMPLQHSFRTQHRFRYAVLAALGVAIVPIMLNILQRGVQTILSQENYRSLEAPELGPIGRVNARPVYFLRAMAMTQFYADTRDAYARLTKQGLTHSDLLTSEPDFQLSWLINTAAALRAFVAFEANNGRRLERIYALDFTDPYPFLLGRQPLRYTQIGLDALRTLPRKDDRMLASIASADGILVPLCPVTPMRAAIAARFAPALEGRQRIGLTPCWDLLLRSGSDFAQADPPAAYK